MVEPLPHEVLKRHLDVALGDMFGVIMVVLGWYWTG